MQVLDPDDTTADTLRAIPGVDSVERTGDEFLIETTYARTRFGEILQALIDRKVHVIGFSEKEGSLEEVFLHVTKGGV